MIFFEDSPFFELGPAESTFENHIGQGFLLLILLSKNVWGIFADNLDTDQALQNVVPDLGQNCLTTLMVFLKETFEKG